LNHLPLADSHQGQRVAEVASMRIQYSPDNRVQRPEAMAHWAECELDQRLTRYRGWITRVEVHLSDACATRSGVSKRRCTLEARLAGRQPVAVSHDAANVADALHGATGKLLRVLDTSLGRLRDAHGHESIRGEGGP
jgi:hypothetical protein